MCYIAKTRGARFLLVGVVLHWAAALGTAKPPTPPEFEEDWFVVTMQNPQTGAYQPCGHMHSVLKRVGEEVHSQTKMKIELRRGEASAELTVEQDYRETVDGRPLSLKLVSSLGAVPETTVGTIEGDRVRLRIEQYGVTKHEGTYPFDPEIKFAWGQELEQRKHGLAPGTGYTVKMYDPSLRKDGPIETKIVVRGKESVDVLGTRRELHRIATSTKLADAPAGMPTTQGGLTIDSDLWVDDAAKPVVMAVDLGFLRVKMYKTSKEEALKRGAPPEMFLETMVPVKQPIPRGAKLLKLRLRLKDGVAGRLPVLPDTAMQKCRMVSDREATITVRRLDWEQIGKVQSEAKVDAKLEPYLVASAVCDAGDRKIKRLARKAVRQAKTPAAKAEALCKFVGEYIIDKNMDVGFASASEVARNRTGDCSEHAVLLAALARAAGLPARGVVGLVAVPGGGVGGRAEAFGYHMWTQVYIGDQWVDIDGSLRQVDCDPTHIAVGLMPLGEEGMMGPVMSLIPLLGQLEIEVMEDKGDADSPTSRVGLTRREQVNWPAKAALPDLRWPCPTSPLSSSPLRA